MSGRVRPLKQLESTRERQVIASPKTTNLSRKALEQQKQCLEPAPRKGRWRGAVLLCPLVGVGRAAFVGALFLRADEGIPTLNACLQWRLTHALNANRF